MKLKSFSMNAIALLKKAAPLVAIFVFAVTLNFGSYDPYNELATFTPDFAAAQVVGGLTLPSLGSTSFSTPSFSNQEFGNQSLSNQELASEELSNPSLEDVELSEQNLSEQSLGGQSLSEQSLGNHELSQTATSSSSSSYTSSTNTTCTFYADTEIVTTGSNLTLTWSTSGFASVTINGEVMNGTSGSKIYTNIQANTTYTLVASSADGKNKCTRTVNIICVPPVVVRPVCELTPAARTINYGESVDLAWTTQNAATANLSSFGAVDLNGMRNTGALSTSTAYTLTVVGTNGETVSCHSNITVRPQVTIKYCELTLEKSVSANSAKPGDELTYTIKIKNTGTKDCTGGGVKIMDIHDDNIIYISETHTSNLNAGYEGNPVYVAATKTIYWNGNTLTPGEEGTIVWKGRVKDSLACDTTTIIRNTAKATAKELSNFTVWAYSNTVETSAYKTCDVPVATCDTFTAAPTLINRGESSTLSWTTTNATRVAIDNAIGVVTPTASGTYAVAPLETTTYTLTAFGTGDQKQTCTATVTVKPITVEELPKCESFTATPTTTPVGGGTVNFGWATKDATGVSISPTIGSVATTGTTSLTVATTTTYTLTASNVAGNKDTCAVTIVVPPPTPTPITCEGNVTLSASPTLITRGDDATITWATTGGITGVRFDNGITSTDPSGSATVSPNDSTTYTMTATDGVNTISCPVSVSVRSGGGGGGGSNAPRCELSVSKKSIRSGESVVLTWDSTRATTLFIEDQNLDKKLVTTEGKMSSEKDELFDGKITVSPKEDTRYLLTVKRGSTTRTCAVEVEVDKNVVVTQIRDQQPLVSGIALTQVPYTGFEAGPILTLLFYVLLMAWALYMAYLLVIRRDVLGGLTLATAKTAPREKFIPEVVRPDVFVAQVQAPVMPVSTLPTNLPTGTPAVGYINHTEDEVETVSSNVHQIDDATMTEIENFAHTKRVLLSSDAIRHFVATTNTETERQLALEQVIVAAKAQYPAEDGWIVLNEKRMQELCLVCAANSVRSSAAPFVPTILPEGAGSLAEAVVTGNVVAAYELIGNRPMFALADAAADLDAVYRIRRGGEAVASEMLMKATATLTETQLLQMISALTGALDGTYTDEAAAVKMAIMKAVKVAA